MVDMELSKHASTLGFSGVLFGSLLVAIDAVALAPSLPVIADAFNASSIETYWAGVAYTLACAAFMPLFPAFSRTFGRRSTTLFAQVLFLIGTIVCGSAQSIGALLAGRTIQGIGGGGIVAMLYVVISDLFEMRWRPKALAINALVWMVGVGVGPVIGGGFSGDISWRWIFWIVLPINAIAIVLTGLFLDIRIPNSPQQDANDEATQEKSTSANLHLLSWKTMDYIGALLLVTSLTSFLIPVCWGGIQFSWSSWHTLVPLILGLVGMAAWVVYEGLIPTNPIMPLSILANRTVAISFIITFVTGVVQFGVVFYLPLYYQIVKGYSPLISGVALLPTNLLSSPLGVVAGMVISKVGKYKMVLVIGCALMALGCGLLVLLDINTSIPAWIFITFPVGAGFGFVLPALTTASTAPVKQEHMAIASGLSPYTRSIGQAIGIAVGNSMVQNLVKNNLAGSTSAILRDNAGLIAESVASSRILSMFMTNPNDRSELLHAYVSALRDFWWLLCGLCLACLVLSLFTKDYSLDRDESSRQKSADGSMTESGKSTPPSSTVSVHAGKNGSRQWNGPDLTEWTSG